MADFLAPFDPTATTGGNLPVQLSNGGWLMIHNVSPTLLGFKVGIMTAPILLPAFTARCFQAPLGSTRITWSKLNTLTTYGVSLSQVYIEVYQPNEWNGGELYLPLAQSQNPQPRVIALPPGVQQWSNSVDTVPANGISKILGSIGLSAANIANQRGEAYLSKLFFGIGFGAAGFSDVSINWVIRNAGGTVLQSIGIMRFHVFGSAAVAPVNWIDSTWPLPLNWDVILPANSANIAIQAVFNATTPAVVGSQFEAHISWWLDLNNSEPVAAIGNAAQHVTPTAFY